MERVGSATVIDPRPRQYPDLVTLMRRSDRGAAVAPERIDCDGICRWLLGDAVRDDDLLTLLESLLWRMAAADLPVDRATVHIGTLHPELAGFYWIWNRDDALIDELKVDQSGLNTARYLRSPLKRVIDSGETFRARTDDASLAAAYPLLADLAAEGYLEYMAFPMGARSRYYNTATIATKRDGGFDDDHVADCTRIFEILALHVERQIALRIAHNVLHTYLGATAGRRVFDGTIRRGAGESIRAIIWVSDLRGFTDRADRLSGADVLAVLNTYFEAMAGAVITRGGEVLKFIGDGLLAVFPVAADEDGREAAEASLGAARDALAAVARLNETRPAPLDTIEGWSPLRSGIALHLGDVFFGNVGAPERLDFTVIGRAVNEASRVESLTKSLDREILVTEAVARLLDDDLESMGEHALRGLRGRAALFAPRAERARP